MSESQNPSNQTTRGSSERAFGAGVAVLGFAMLSVGSLLLLPRDGGPALLIGIGSIVVSLGLNHWKPLPKTTLPIG